MLRSNEPIALEANALVTVLAPGIDLDQVAADVAVFRIPFQCSVIRAQAVIGEACAGTTPGVVKFDKRPTAGSDTGRGDGDIGVLQMATTPAGDILFDKMAQGTILNPGEEVVCEIATRPLTGAAGHFWPQLLVKYDPETIANMTGMVETA